MGFQLAFNTVGWNPTDLGTATLDALIGDPSIAGGVFGAENPAETIASSATRPCTPAARSRSTRPAPPAISALVGNSATSAPAALFGAGGMSVSGVLASSMVSSVVRAFFVDGSLTADNAFTPPTGSLNPGDRVESGGHVYEFVGEPRGPPRDDSTEHFATNADWQRVDAVSITATDAASISSTTQMYAEVSPTNDAGAGILNQWAGTVLDDYKYTSKSGTRT